MKNILRVFMLGTLVGILLGVYFNERGQIRKAKEEAAAIANDPEGKELLALSRRLRQTDQWVDEIEEEVTHE